jgi:hypothetical protein
LPDKDANGLSGELSVQKETFFKWVGGIGGHIFCLAGKGVFRWSALRLYLSAVFAYFEPPANIINTGNRKLFTDDITLTEVDFSHGRFSDKLIPKGELVIVHAEGFRYVVLLVYIN